MRVPATADKPPRSGGKISPFASKSGVLLPSQDLLFLLIALAVGVSVQVMKGLADPRAKLDRTYFRYQDNLKIERGEQDHGRSLLPLG
jgi:hypothetical protein